MSSKVERSAAKPKPPNAGKGRKKGVPNKTTAALKTAILNAFDAAGGEHYLRHVADTDPKTFCTLLGKVLPAEIKAEHSGDLVLNISLKRYSGD